MFQRVSRANADGALGLQSECPLEFVLNHLFLCLSGQLKNSGLLVIPFESSFGLLLCKFDLSYVKVHLSCHLKLSSDL